MDASAPTVSPYVGLSDWRRRVADIHGQVRFSHRPGDTWEPWRQQRDALLAAHPRSPLDDIDRASFDGLDYFDYDPALRFVVDVAPASTTNCRVLQPANKHNSMF